MEIIVFSQSISSLLQLSLIQSRSFGAKLGPSSCTWAVLPGDLPLLSHGRFTPACAARTVVFGPAGEAFGIICSYSVLPCVALEKLEWRWVWDTSNGTTAVGFRYSLAPLQSKLKSVERFAWRSLRVDQLPRAACWRDTRTGEENPSHTDSCFECLSKMDSHSYQYFLKCFFLRWNATDSYVNVK